MHNKILSWASHVLHIYRFFRNGICALSTHFISWFKRSKYVRFTTPFRNPKKFP